MAQPRIQMTRRARRVVGTKRADAQTRHRHAVLVGVQPPERFTERFRHAIAAVGPHHHGVVDHTVTPMKPHRMIRACEDDPLHARLARRFEHVVAAVDIHVADLLPRVFVRNAGEMHDHIHVPHDLAQLLGPRDVRGDDFLMLARERLRRDIRETQRVLPCQTRAPHLADQPPPRP